jgi:hypothetical protein
VHAGASYTTSLGDIWLSQGDTQLLAFPPVTGIAKKHPHTYQSLAAFEPAPAPAPVLP